MARVKGLGKRRRVKVRVSESDVKTVLQTLPVLLAILFMLWSIGWISGISFSANVTSGWP